jgi:glycosyltransferase involved in cell wall biosynthesis
MPEDGEWDMSVAPTLDNYREYALRRSRATTGPMPKISLVTVTLNAGATLARAVESVQRQSFRDIEHVVVDGASSDGTRDLLGKALRPQDYWISEPDRGISDAMNKGVALARGAYVQFIHADDWLSPDQVERAVETLERSGADFVYGDLVFYERDQPAFGYAGAPDYQRVIARRMPALNHPTVLARMDCFRQIGLFDLRYACAMDYDWFMRLHLAGGQGVYDPRIRGHMSHDGISNLQFHRTIREVCAIAVAHGRNPWLAHLEAACRHAKMATGRWTKARARPLYDLVRRGINPAFRPLT